MRQPLKGNMAGMNPHFTYRGKEQTRIETFSDAVFALAVTLLILSSTVPETFAEFYSSLTDIVPFGICIVLLTLVWYQHYIFFIRYGLKDVKIVTVNTILLFTVLIYVYPLKFLFKILFQIWFAVIAGDNARIERIFTDILKPEQTITLMTVYGLGAAGLFLILAWMYFIAFRRREILGLSPIEIFITRTSLYNNLILGGVPLLSVLVALIFNSFTLSGFTYWLYMLLMPLFNTYRSKRMKKLFPELA